MQQPDTKTGLGLVVLATVCWSLSGLFVRLLPQLDGWQINCWRGFWLSLTLIVYLAWRHGRNLPKAFTDVPRVALVVSAICFAIGTGCYVTSLTLVNTATVATIGATAPLVTMVLSTVITGERPQQSHWLAALLALGGVAIIAKHGYEFNDGRGLLLAFCVPVTFALQTLLLRRYRSFDLMTAICLGGLLSFAISALVSLVVTGHSAFALSTHDMILLMVMGVLQLGLPLILYGFGARALPAALLSLVAMLDAVFNPFWAWAFAGEWPEASTVLGGVLIMIAVLGVFVLRGNALAKPA